MQAFSGFKSPKADNNNGKAGLLTYPGVHWTLPSRSFAPLIPENGRPTNSGIELRLSCTRYPTVWSNGAHSSGTVRDLHPVPF